jgi:hypothetical protein
MDATERIESFRRKHRRESGQVLVLFVLIFITLALFAIVAVSVGQVLVRRHQAQAIVDLAAFSGAAKQAEGMNTIARFNEKELHFLRAIEESKLLPYMDSDDTTWGRYGESFIGPLALPFASDWAGDVLEGYQSVFDVMNDFIDIINMAYSPWSPIGPHKTADDVIEANFGDESDKIFKSDDLDSNGFIITTDALSAHLVELSDPDTYEINGYTYVPYAANAIITDDCPLIFPLDEPCLQLLGFYGMLNTYIIIKRFIDPIEYELGKFYDNEDGDDVRFAYYLRVSQAPVLFGKNFFDDIPPITVAAAAKPYGGYLGDKFETNPIFYDNQSGKEISYTYKAKLVPLTNEEKAALALRFFSTEDATRWLPTGVQH